MVGKLSVPGGDEQHGWDVGFGRAGEEAVETGCGVAADENRDGDECPDQDWGAGQAAETPSAARSRLPTVARPIVASGQKW